MGVQATFEDLGAVATSGIANTRAIIGGLAFVVGDTISLSYGRGYEKIRYNDAMRGTGFSQASGKTQPNQRTHYDGNIGDTGLNEYENVDYGGFSVAVNIGPVAIKGTKNNVDGMGENGGSSPRSHSEINLSIAF
jgi:hypothetical protein